MNAWVNRDETEERARSLSAPPLPFLTEFDVAITLGSVTVDDREREPYSRAMRLNLLND